MRASRCRSRIRMGNSHRNEDTDHERTAALWTDSSGHKRGLRAHQPMFEEKLSLFGVHLVR
jgi:hypothetical protein